MVARWWTAAKGGIRYGLAVMRGDVASPETQAARVRKCAACPHATRRKLLDRPALWCGEPLVETDRTCGCLVAAEAAPGAAVLTVGGVPLAAAGKSEVGSERCPAGEWDVTSSCRRHM